ncbi:probable UDP-N-acetylglucosamine--peptide N-acetylglucosaminyltransferase SEC [Zingiber officinale]|uniref:probable UDP-N-acetylglucosamine--peptide N-acetylglucosaminyltransferase SEC n=1 Tax=Zingiber officinale TaxID=94328 RepID=UPI001C4B93BE|nr:probable UDP-N-acetylglucosamine--peptide N-acetylglucosaminyltransferase SEC [Zingiber officinale]
MQVLHNITVAEYFHWNMLRNLAGIYYEQSQLDMAILHYKQAINCDSTFIEAYNNLGNALKDVGHALKDAGHYRSCFALQPNHPQALSSLGSIYMDCNMMSVPTSFYKATLAVTTGISALFNNLAIIYKQQVEIQLECHLDCYEIEVRRIISDGWSLTI